eukprot:gene31539-40953_t
MDWKHRHKNHCEVKNVRRTAIIFGIHKTRLEDYKIGKTSFDRYYSIALMRAYKDLFPEAKTSLHSPAYRIRCSEESSGCILTGRKIISREPRCSIPLSPKEQQLRLAAGLPLKDATELVPLNEDILSAYGYHFSEMVTRSMRYALNHELRFLLIAIEIVIAPGLGWGYGNPVFLSLKNALAYEDFIRKNFGVELRFPFNLCCSILFPEFNPSMCTGNPKDADKLFDLDSEENLLVYKEVAPVTPYLEIFDRQLMKEEQKEEDDAFKKVEGESEDDGYMRYYAYSKKCDPMRYARFILAEHCLAVVPADQSCFPTGQEGCPLLD